MIISHYQANCKGFSEKKNNVLFFRNMLHSIHKMEIFAEYFYNNAILCILH